jgi:hypothetical protein
MLSNTPITERNKETFTSAEKLCLSDKKIALELLYEPSERFLNNKGKEQFRRKCKECSTFKVGDLSGHANFLKHITTCVPIWKDRIISAKGQGNGGPLDSSFPPVTEKAKTIHSWLEWAIMTDSPSTFVENKYNRKYSRLEPICRPTYNKYKDIVYKMVLLKIKEELPPYFMIYFDGWTCDGEHYVCMFATWTNSSGGVIIRHVTLRLSLLKLFLYHYYCY